MRLYPALGLSFLVVLLLTSQGCSSTPDRPEKVSETRNRAAEYTEFGNRYLDRAQFDQALKFYNLALEDNIAIDNKEGIVLSRNAIGETFLILGQLEKAESSFTAALELSRRLARGDLELRSLNNLGKLALNRGQSGEALVIFKDALAIIEAQNSPPDEVTADVYHSTGALYKLLEEYDRALEYLEASLKLNRGLKRQEEIASNYYVLASVYSKQRRFDEAEAGLRRALEIDKQIENKLGIADDYYALGLVAEKRGDRESAYEQFRIAVDKYIILNNFNATLETLYRLKELAALLGRENEARSYDETISLIEEQR
jgi:tetratricopeptide (TPR) repeat protein